MSDLEVPLFTSLQMAAFYLGFGGFVALITAASVWLLGRKLVRRSRVAAMLVCALVAPFLLFALAIIQLLLAPTGPPPNDAPAMVFIATLFMAGLSLLVSFPTSLLLFLMTGRRERGD